MSETVQGTASQDFEATSSSGGGFWGTIGASLAGAATAWSDAFLQKEIAEINASVQSTIATANAEAAAANAAAAQANATAQQASNSAGTVGGWGLPNWAVYGGIGVAALLALGLIVKKAG